jgi:NSS family neurotransmitter:Na+ symporter
MWCLLLALGRPLHRGIELAIKIVAPVFFLLLISELLYSHKRGDWSQAVSTLMSFDFATLGLRGFWLAVGQAFFSLGLGTAALMMYGAYLPARASVRAVAFWVVSLDVAVSIIGALIVLPVVYLAGSDLSAGPSLIAQSAAVGYNTLAYGQAARTLLFMLLFLAAWMAALGMAEPIVSWLEARRIGRLKSAVIVVGIAWLLGVAVALSFNYWRFSFVFDGLLKTLGAVDVVQIAVSGIAMPLVGFCIAIFAGWSMPHEAMFAGGGRISHIGFHVWRWLLRVLVPVWCIAVLMNMRLFL